MAPPASATATLAEVEAELREHATDAARLGIVGLRQRIDRRVLALLDPDRADACSGAIARPSSRRLPLQHRWCANRLGLPPIERQQEGPLSVEQGRL
jgi:hypothetical protein